VAGLDLERGPELARNLRDEDVAARRGAAVEGRQPVQRGQVGEVCAADGEGGGHAEDDRQ
jgi:hypothetical protein